MRFADLHLHTVHSDGIRSPREVIDLGVEHRLDILAISDHDNVAAYAEVVDYAAERSILLIAATELSAEYRGIDIHLLAYAFSIGNAELQRALEQFRESRQRRGITMVEKLRSLGYDIEMRRVEELRGDGALGRPHVARALVEIGAAESIDDAFDRLLTPGRPGFVPKPRFSIDEAIRLVHSAGGLLSLAHPSLYPGHRTIVQELMEMGIDAIEVLHPKVGNDDLLFYEALARHHGRFVTGGSDDHGYDDRQSIGTVRLSEERIGPILERVEMRA